MPIDPNAWARPQNLSEVAEKTSSSEEFGRNLKDFLHAFKAAPSYEKIAQMPPWLAARLSRGELMDAYLAGVAVELSKELGRTRPAWTFDAGRTLREPYFAADSDDLRIILLHESPAGFRERNIFVSDNALSVA